MSSSSDEFINLTPPQVLNTSKKATLSLLPEKSTDRYLQAYQNFILWKTSQNANSFSENVFLAYFMELSHKYKSSSLWCYYSMLKSTMKTNHGIDIKSYSNLLAFLKRRSDGHMSKKSKVFSADNIKMFLKEAPDCRYLATKEGKLKGEDCFGNKFYENPRYTLGRNRWVEFSSNVKWDYNASQITPEWYGWLHYKTDCTPDENDAKSCLYNCPEVRAWLLPYEENVSGTPKAYYPYTTTRPNINVWDGRSIQNRNSTLPCEV